MCGEGAGYSVLRFRVGSVLSSANGGGGYMNISEKVNSCIKNLTATGVVLCSSALPNLRADF